MRHVSRSLVLLSLVVALPVCVSAQAETDSPLAKQIDPLLEELFSYDLSPGMSVAVVLDDRIAYTRGFGLAEIASGRPVTASTRFYIASTTKSLTALACALLADQGELDLHTPVQRYVPDLRFHRDIDPERITLERLLTHTHGLEGIGPVVIRTAFTGDYDRGQLLRLTAHHGPAESGEAFRYSNIGYNIAGFVLEEITGETWKDAVDELVLRPLHLRETTAYVSRLDPAETAVGYRPTPEGFEIAAPTKTDETMHAAGGHYTTASDMAAWVGAVMNKGWWIGEQVFPASVVEDVTRKHADQDRTFGEIKRYGWGLGWDLGTYNGDTLVHRFGSYAGFRSHVSFMPSRKVGVVVLVNDGALGSMLADGAAFLVYNHLRKTEEAASINAGLIKRLAGIAPMMRQRLAEELRKRAARDQTLPFELSAYAGRYENGAYGTMRCQVEEGKLVFRFGGLKSAAEVYDNDKNQFRVELTGGGSVVTFEMTGGQGKKVTFNGVEFARIE